MGKPEFKSPRLRNMVTKPGLVSKARSAPVRGSSANVKVVVRVRPPNEKEEGDNFKQVIDIIDEQLLIFDPKVHSNAFFYHGVEQKGRDLLRKANKNLQFVFDRVFGFDSNNSEIFENTTKDLISCLMDGYNCSVFAYGATGAGKTHTMLGSHSNRGITYLTMAELFKVKGDLHSERSFELGISYIEVYNEQVQDLLNPGAPLQLRDDGRYGVMVAGIKIQKIDNPEDLFFLLEQGNNNRTQHPTDANAESSRSHAVFQVYIQMEFKSTREVRTAKLSMIDLAGSERGSATGYGGARFTEGANINKSLLALGNCINSLADGQKYIPYRDSKLTRLLKDSLGGNCQTVMIANISPSSMTFEDTYNTLKYAARAKKIKADIKKNVVNVHRHAGEYVKIIEDLKKELDKLKSQAREKAAEDKVDVKIAQALYKLMGQRHKLLNRMYNIESTECTVKLRRQLKQDTDSRLSCILEDTDKDEARRRLGDTVNRFNLQEESYSNELEEIAITRRNLENQTDELLKQHPEIKTLVQIENEKLLKQEAEYKANVNLKKFGLIEEELKSKMDVLEKTCRLLQSCYHQIKGFGFLSESLRQEYLGLVNDFQGKRSLTWDSPVDSAISSTSVSSTEIEIRPTKRKITDENRNGLDGTFVLEEPSKPKVKYCTEVIAKACKSPLPLKKKAVLGHQIRERRDLSATRTRGGVPRKPLIKPDEKKRPVFRT